MSLLQVIRASPSYLFLKCYIICTLVTIFAARPLSSRLNANGPWTWYESTEGGHGMSSWGRMQALLASATTRREGRTADTSFMPASLQHWWQERRFPFLFPPPQIPLSLAPPTRMPSIPFLERWKLRWEDMAHLRGLLKLDEADRETFPELDWDAKVRCSSELHPDERVAIAKRQVLMSSEGTNALAHFLQLPDDEYVHPEDVPLIAIGGSGGGYRAMYGYAGFIKEAENTGLWQCTMWCSSVSGSCWTLAALYTIAQGSTDIMIAHMMAMANEEAHPMSLQAMDRVARSSRGIYYLLGPLMRKARNKKMHCRIMDFYAMLVLTYQFLPRPLSLLGTDYSYNGPSGDTESVSHEHWLWSKYKPTEGLSRKSFQWSKVWERRQLGQGLQPIPILTGVRRVWRPHPSPDSASGASHPPLVGSGYDWYEISPLELGCRNIGAWIPTWAYGRPFENGKSLVRAPEQMLATIAGQCTGAPAGPLTAYISTMLASIPQGTVMSTLLAWINDFVMMKQWEKRWGNPIRAADEPNPFYGRGMDDIVVDMAENDDVLAPPSTSSPSAGPTQDMSAAPTQDASTAPTQSTSPVDLPYLGTSTPLIDFTKAPMPTPPPPAAMSSSTFLQPTTAQMNAFFSQLPRLPELAMEHTLRPRRGSDASVSTSVFENDPETFMAPLEDLSTRHHEMDEPEEPPRQRQWKWEHTRRLRLMDSGLSNNLPNHVLAREERQADVIISFDASSDVMTGAAVARIHDFGREVGIEIKAHPNAREPIEKDEAPQTAPKPMTSSFDQSPESIEQAVQNEAAQIRAKFEPKYAQRLDGWRTKNGPSTDREPDINFVYCPLLPNAVQPGFDPTTAHYSTSYNLIWTPDQVRALLRTAMANVEEGSHAIGVIREAVREAYERKKKARLEREAKHPSVKVTAPATPPPASPTASPNEPSAAASKAGPVVSDAMPAASATSTTLPDVHAEPPVRADPLSMLAPAISAPS